MLFFHWSKKWNIRIVLAFKWWASHCNPITQLWAIPDQKMGKDLWHNLYSLKFKNFLRLYYLFRLFSSLSSVERNRHIGKCLLDRKIPKHKPMLPWKKFKKNNTDLNEVFLIGYNASKPCRRCHGVSFWSDTGHAKSNKSTPVALRTDQRLIGKSLSCSCD